VPFTFSPLASPTNNPGDEPPAAPLSNSGEEGTAASAAEGAAGVPESTSPQPEVAPTEVPFVVHS